MALEVDVTKNLIVVDELENLEAKQLLDFNIKKLMIDDPLKPLQFICKLFLRKPFQPLLIFMLVLHTDSIIIHVTYFIDEFNLDFFFKYLSLFTLSIYGNVAILMQLINDNALTDFTDKIDFWSHDTAGEDTAAKIKKESFYVNFLSFLNIGLALALPALSLNRQNDDTEFFLILKFLWLYYFPGVTEYLDLFLRIQMFAFISIIVVPALQAMYFMQHFKFQVYLLRQFLKSVDAGPDHRRTGDRLKFCIKRHNELMRFEQNQTGQVQARIVVFSLAGVLAGIGGLVYCYLCVKGGMLVRAFIAFATFFLTFFNFIAPGQNMEEETGMLAAAILENPWYLWDKQNRQVLLTFLPQLMKPCKNKFTETVAVNYELGVKVVKGMYSLISVMIQLKSSRA